jgi:hypothetical protein
VADSPGAAVGWLLFAGSSVHVASTGWLFTARQVRTHAASHRVRYLLVPLALVGGAGAAAVLLPHERLNQLLLLYFGWQFWHYHRQNYGLAALAASSQGINRVSTLERRALMATGSAGVTGVLSQPALLGLTSAGTLRFTLPIAATLFVAGGFGGMALLLRRPQEQRPAVFCAGYLMALLFFGPVFVFTAPYAAVGSLVIAHGLQYLMLTGLVSTGDRRGLDRLQAAATMVCVALAAGALLNTASHLHTGGAVERFGYGAYLGIVMTHFIVDADIWRLRDPARRRFIAARVPFLLPAPVADGSGTDIGSAA